MLLHCAFDSTFNAGLTALFGFRASQSRNNYEKYKSLLPRRNSLDIFMCGENKSVTKLRSILNDRSPLLKVGLSVGNRVPLPHRFFSFKSLGRKSDQGCR